MTGSTLTRRGGGALLAGAALVILGHFLIFGCLLLAYPYQWEFREGVSLCNAVVLARGESPYELTDQGPLHIVPWGPVYPLVCVPTIWLLGERLVGPRLISFLSMLLLSLGVGSLVRRETGSWVWALVAAVVPISSSAFWSWQLLCRPDALATLLLFGCLAVLSRWGTGPRPLVVAAILGLAAGLAKQPNGMGLLSVALYLGLVRREWRRAAWFIGGSAAGGIGIVLLLQWVSRGTYSTMSLGAHAVFTILNPARMMEQFRVFLRIHGWLLPLAAWTAWRQRRISIWHIHSVVGLSLLVYLLQSEGGSIHYFYVVLPALAVAGLPAVMERRPWIRTLAIVLVAIPLLQAAKRNLPPRPEADAAGGSSRWGRLLRRGERIPHPTRHLADRWVMLEDLVRRSDQVLNSEATCALVLLHGKDWFEEGFGFQEEAPIFEAAHGLRLREHAAGRIRMGQYDLLLNPPECFETEVHSRYRLAATFQNLGEQFGRKSIEPVRAYVLRGGEDPS